MPPMHGWSGVRTKKKPGSAEAPPGIGLMWLILAVAVAAVFACC